LRIVDGRIGLSTIFVVVEVYTFGELVDGT
jgi:hypothetical protein